MVKKLYSWSNKSSFSEQILIIPNLWPAYICHCFVWIFCDINLSELTPLYRSTDECTHVWLTAPSPAPWGATCADSSWSLSSGHHSCSLKHLTLCSKVGWKHLGTDALVSVCLPKGKRSALQFTAIKPAKNPHLKEPHMGFLVSNR